MKLRLPHIFVICYILLCSGLLFPHAAFAIAEKYLPGETLDPACVPGEINCSVEDVWTASSSAVYYVGDYVGIGTESPDTPLTVFSNGPQSKLHIGNEDGSTRGLYLSSYTSPGNNNVYFGNAQLNSSAQWVPSGTYASLTGFDSDGASFYSDNGLTDGTPYTPTLRMIIANSGNVGVGIETPTYTFDVVGDINYTGTLYNNGTPVSFGGGSGDSVFTIGSGVIYSATSTDKVGIGTSNPLSKLDVSFSDNTSTAVMILENVSDTEEGRGEFFDFREGSSRTVVATFGHQSDASVFGDGTAQTFIASRVSGEPLAFMVGGSSAEKMRITSVGNVGIGTTTPSEKLVVDGDVNMTGALRFDGDAGTAGYVLQSNGSASPQWVATSSLGISGGGGSGTVTSVALTTPTGLSVSGSPITSSGTLALSLTSGYVIPLVASSSEWAAASASSTLFSDFYLTPSTRITAGTGLSWSGNTLNASGGGSGNSAFTIGNGLIHNATTSDNVGIGTTTPGYALTVGGSINFTGNLYNNGSVVSFGGGGGGITSLNGQTEGTQTFATSSDTNIALHLTSSGGVHTLTPAWTGTLAASRGGTGISSVSANGILVGNAGGTGWTQIATTSLGLRTLNVTEDTNLYFTDTRARAAITESITAIDYSSGAFSLTSGYVIPLTASTTDWTSFFDTPSTRITAGTGLSWSGNTLNATLGGGNSAFTIGNGFIYNATTSDMVGIGSSTPTATLAIQGSTSAPTRDLFAVASSSGSQYLTVRSNGNVGIGSMTAGSLLFATTSGVIAQDNSNLFWDDTNNRFGLATAASPQVTFHIAANNDLYSTTNLTSGASIRVGSVYQNQTYTTVNTSATAINGAYFRSSFNLASPEAVAPTLRAVSIEASYAAASAALTSGGLTGIDVASSNFNANNSNSNITGASISTSYGSTSAGAATIATGVISNVSTASGSTLVLGIMRGNRTNMSHGSATTLGEMSGQYSQLSNTNASGIITNAYGFFTFLNQNSGTITNTYGAYVGDITSGTQTNTPYSFYASDANAIGMYSAGKVGIGTTTPTEMLSVAGNALINGLITTSSIDATSTSATSTFSGNLKLSGRLIDGNNASGTLGMVLQSTGTSVQWVATSSLGISGGGSGSAAGGSGAIQFSDGASGFIADDTNFLWDNTGKYLGIGTTTPGSRLTVQGDINFTGTLYQNGLNVAPFILAGTGNIYSSTAVAPSAGSYNLFSGSSAAGAGLSTGDYNIFSGYQAGYANTSGGDNVFLGRNAGYTNADGYSNTAIGYGADMGSASLTNATAIGAGAIVSASSSIVLGTSGISVGIGVSAPTQKLETNGTIYSNGSPSDTPLTGTAFLLPGGTVGMRLDSAGRFNLDVASTSPVAALTINQNGNIGLGVADALSKLSVEGAGSFTGLVMGQYFTASANDLASTFPLASTTALTVANDAYMPGGVWNSSGYVGIGTTTPGSRLTVQGDINFTGTLYQNGLNVAPFILAGTGNIYSSTAVAPSAGSYNLFSGSSAAGAGLSTGDYNIFSGYQAGYANTSGGDNVFLGRNAGYTNADGYSNTAIGYGADMGSASLTNATAIGAGAIVSASSSIVLGTSGISVGIGVSAPTQKLETNGTIYSNGSASDSPLAGTAFLFPGGTAGMRLDSAGRFNLDVASTSPVAALTINQNGNIGLGVADALSKLSVEGAGSFTGLVTGQYFTASANDLASTFPLASTTAITVSTDAYMPGGVWNSSGYVGIGTTTPDLRLAVDGNINFTGTLFRNGIQSNVFSVDGTHNIYSSANTATPTGGSYNIYTGYESAGMGLSTGDYNVFSGFQSGYNNTSGASNVFIGLSAGTSNQEGAGNTIIGANANVASTTLTNATAIGSGAVVGASNALVLGDDNVSVGIGVTVPLAQLHTDGTVRFAAFGAGPLESDADGNITVSSDERLKDIESGFSRGLAEILNINPIRYRWKPSTGYDRDNIYTGFSAQNVQSAIPEAVMTDKRGYLTLNDRPITAALVNAVKTLDARINAFRTEVVTDKVVTKTLCLEDVCVTKEQLQALLLQSQGVSGTAAATTATTPTTTTVAPVTTTTTSTATTTPSTATSSPETSSSATSTSATSTPEPTPESTPEVTPEPASAPEPTPEPTLEPAPAPEPTPEPAPAPEQAPEPVAENPAQ